VTALSIVIVSYNTVGILRDCLQAALLHSRALPTQIIVVDNASSDGSASMVQREFPSVHLIEAGANLGFGAANNLGVKATQAPFVLLLNSDAILHSDTGAALVDYLQRHPDVACVGPRIMLRDGRRQPKVFGEQPTLWRVSMQNLGLNRLFPRSRLLRGVDSDHLSGPEMDTGWISGVCMAMRREDFVRIGGFDESIFMYCEDIDLCSRLQQRGGRIVHLDTQAVTHWLGASSKTTAARVRNAVWQQRNMLKIVERRNGRAAGYAARLVLLGGQGLRVLAGLALAPRDGLEDNLLLRASCSRVLDLVGLLRNRS
jgi:GT2 family glycosyltransferase